MESLRGEFDRARISYEKLNLPSRIRPREKRAGTGPAGSDAAVAAFAEAMGVQKPAAAAQRGATISCSTKNRPSTPKRGKKDSSTNWSPSRSNCWSTVLVAATSFGAKPAAIRQKQWTDAAEFYRNYVWEEMIGKLPDPTIPPNVRTRQVIDDPALHRVRSRCSTCIPT